MERITFEKIPGTQHPMELGDYVVIDRWGHYRVMSFTRTYGRTSWRDEMENEAEGEVKFWLKEVIND